MEQSLNISIINGICLHKDAISESVRGTALAMEGVLKANVRVYCYDCDYEDMNYIKVSEVKEIILDDFFDKSDIVIYHFGIYYELFNSIYLAGSKKKKIVVYHNVTPKEFLPKASHYLTDKSIAQQANMAVADRIITVSEFNRQTLIDYGVPADQIDVVPLYARFDCYPAPVATELEHRKVELLYVGRFVESKGVLDLVEAISLIKDCSGLILRLVGNEAFSDQAYIKKVQQLVEKNNLEDVVIFEGTVDEETLVKRYIAADIFVIPSYHEGFCVPVLEAMHFGCIPLGYSSGNLGELIGSYGLQVEGGDIDGLAAAITKLRLISLGNAADHRNNFVLENRNFSSRAEYDKCIKKYLEKFSFDKFCHNISRVVMDNFYK